MQIIITRQSCPGAPKHLCCIRSKSESHNTPQKTTPSATRAQDAKI